MKEDINKIDDENIIDIYSNYSNYKDINENINIGDINKIDDKNKYNYKDINEKSNNPPEKSGINVSQLEPPYGVDSDPFQILKQYLRIKTKPGVAAFLRAAQELELAADTEPDVDSNTAAEAKFSTGDGVNTDGISGGGKRRKKSKKKKSKSKHKRSRKSKRKSKTRRRR